MPEQQQIGGGILSLLGSPLLSYDEKQSFLRSYEQRMGIETETARIKNEQQKLLHEGEKLKHEGEKTKQAFIARAIESMTPGWERGGQRVDIGQFQGREVAVGPGPMGREITSALGPDVQYRQPGAEQQRMGQQLVRREMGLTPEDPMDVFDRQIQTIQEKEFLRGKEARKTEEFRVGQETRREAAGITKLHEQEQVRAKTAEKGQIAQLEREMKKKFEDTLTEVQVNYDKVVQKTQADPLFRAKPRIEQKSTLAELRDAFEATIRIVADRGEQHGIKINTSSFFGPRDPSVLSSDQIEWYKGADKKQKRAFDKAYEERFGKKPGVKVE